MYIIVGLGNPDRKYQGTRHNIGFDVVDAFAKRFSIDVINKKFNALVGTGGPQGCAGEAADLYESQRRKCAPCIGFL